MLLISFLSLLLVQVDKIIISKLIPLADYGYYTLSTTLASGLFLLAIPISQAFGPQLTRLSELENNEALINAYHLGSQLMSVVVGGTSAVLIFYSDWILLLWTGNETLKDNSSILVSVLTFGNMLNCLMWIPYQGQLAYAWTGFSIKVNALAIIILIPLIILITPLYGANGAAFIWVALNIGYIVFAIHYMHKKIFLKEKGNWYVMDVIAPITASFLLVLFSRLIFSGVTSWYERIAILIIVSFGSYLASVIASNMVRRKFLSILLLNR
jgi:O-antigen/teichoic acid export membrane protein